MRLHLRLFPLFPYMHWGQLAAPPLQVRVVVAAVVVAVVAVVAHLFQSLSIRHRQGKHQHLHHSKHQ
jgi:hypothetical protein